MKRIMSFVLAVSIILFSVPLFAIAGEPDILIAQANVLSTEEKYDTCKIYFYEDGAFMSTDDIERYTRAAIKKIDRELTISLGSREITVDLDSGILNEDGITANIKTLEYNDKILIHAYPILTYLGAECGIENEKLIINMPKVTMWEGLIRSSAESSLDISEFGDEDKQNCRLFLNGILRTLDSGLFETLLNSSVKESIVYSMQVAPFKYNSALKINNSYNTENDDLLQAMAAANDFGDGFSNFGKESISLTEDLAMEFFKYAFKDDDFENEIEMADGVFKALGVVSSVLSNISTNSKCYSDSLEMIETFSKYVDDDSKYYDISQELKKKVQDEVSSRLEAVSETAKVEVVKHISKEAIEAVGDSAKKVFGLFEKSIDMSVLLHKAFYGENNAFSYAKAETACINLLRLKSDLKDIIVELGETIISENYTNKQNIEDYRLLNVFYYRVLIAANEQCKALIIANGREERDSDTIALLDSNNEIFAENLYKLIISEGKEFPSIPDVSLKNPLDSWNDLKEEAVMINVDNIVTDRINYSRDVDVTDPQFEHILGMGYESGDFTHVIIIPEINLDGNGANKLNEKMYELCSDSYELVLNHEEHSLIDIYYDYSCKENVLSICINIGGAALIGGGYNIPYYFYYDIENDCEISMEEYLEKLNITQEDIWSEFITTDEYEMDNYFIIKRLDGCMIGDGFMKVTYGSSGYSDTVSYNVEI